MFHSTPASNRSIRRFRQARHSLARQDGRRHRTASPAAAARPAAGSGTPTVVVMAGSRRSRDQHLTGSHEPGPRPARWPADGWSLGSLAPSGPRLAWAGGAVPEGARPEAPWERRRSSRGNEDLEAVETSMPYVGRTSGWAGSRSSLRGAGRAPSPGPDPAGQGPQGFGRPSPKPGVREQAASSQDGGPAWSARRPASLPQRAGSRETAPVQASMQTRAGGRSPQAAAGWQAGAARWTVLDLTKGEPVVRAAQHAVAARGEVARAPGARREAADSRRWSSPLPATPSAVPSLPQVFRLSSLRAPEGPQ